MLRVAVIFHGIIGGLDARNGIGKATDIELCSKIIHKQLLSRYECDTFIHTWSTNYKDELAKLYKPKEILAEPQEYFGFTFNDYTNEHDTHSFRTVSRYNSLERALKLKDSFNKEYDWVFVLRFDLIFFNPINLENLDNTNFYVTYEPHWPSIESQGLVHDITFLSNSEIMKRYGEIAHEIRNNKYMDTLHATHAITFRKLKEIFNGNLNKIKFNLKRYEDVEIYRFVMRPELNTVGHAYGALNTKDRLNKLLLNV